VAAAAARLTNDLVLTLDLGGGLRQIQAVPVAGLDRDYFRNAIPAEGALVGPFQRLADGENRLRLWPRP
jgi:hypothetical protein